MFSLGPLGPAGATEERKGQEKQIGKMFIRPGNPARRRPNSLVAGKAPALPIPLRREGLASGLRWVSGD